MRSSVHIRGEGDVVWVHAWRVTVVRTASALLLLGPALTAAVAHVSPWALSPSIVVLLVIHTMVAGAGLTYVDCLTHCDAGVVSRIRGPLGMRRRASIHARRLLVSKKGQGDRAALVVVTAHGTPFVAGHWPSAERANEVAAQCIGGQPVGVLALVGLARATGLLLLFVALVFALLSAWELWRFALFAACGLLLLVTDIVAVSAGESVEMQWKLARRVVFRVRLSGARWIVRAESERLAIDDGTFQMSLGKIVNLGDLPERLQRTIGIPLTHVTES